MQSKTRILLLFFFIWLVGLATAKANPCVEETNTEIRDDCVEPSISDLVAWPSAKLLTGNSINFTATITTVDPSCFGGSDGSITYGDSGFFYYWSNGQTGQTATGLTAGGYWLTVTDGWDYYDFRDAYLFDPPLLQATITTNENAGNCSPATSASVTASGGTAPFSYIWSTGAATQSINPNNANYVSVTVTDSNGCQTTADVALFTNTLQVNVQTTPNSATASASGGTANYTYVWSNGASTPTITNLAAGNYSLTVYDGNTCQTTTIFNITGFSISGNIVDCNGDPLSLVTVSLTGTENIITTTDANGNYFFNSLNQGNYTVIPSRNSTINGVSVLDILLIKGHILGNTITDDCSLIAADVNESCGLSVLDLIAIANVIQGSSNTFPSGNTWRFVPDNYNSTGSVPCNFPESLQFNSLTQNQVNQDFKAARIGDVNSSASN